MSRSALPSFAHTSPKNESSGLSGTSNVRHKHLGEFLEYGVHDGPWRLIGVHTEEDGTHPCLRREWQGRRDQDGGSGMEGGTEDLKSNPYANDVPLIMIHNLHCFSLASETVYYFSLD